MNVEGLISIPSSFGAKETMDRLEAALRASGTRIFARIDHAEGAASVGEPLRPTEVILFGNPKVGTALMQSRQTAGLDLPLKALVFEDAAGKAWICYNDPAWLARRHGVGSEGAASVAQMAAALGALTGKASSAT